MSSTSVGAAFITVAIMGSTLQPAFAFTMISTEPSENTVSSSVGNTSKAER